MPREVQLYIAKLVLTALLVVLVCTLFSLRRAGAHEWFNDHVYKTPDGAGCCNGQDCKVYPTENVSVTPDGYLLHDGVKVPFRDAHMSQDRDFWRCDWGGRFRCLFVVVGGS